jgi:hypothetical protein
LKLDEVIVNDLSKNKSIKDLDALYFLQRINDPKLQVEKYFQLVNKLLTTSIYGVYNIGAKAPVIKE